MQRLASLVDLISQIQPLAAYLAEARANLPADHPWSERADAQRMELLNDLRQLAKGEKQVKAGTLTRELEKLKADYITAYTELHRQLVLGPTADDQRKKLYSDIRLKALDGLSEIELLNAGGGSELSVWKQTVQKLPTCREFHEGMLADSPTCRSCNFRPAQASLVVNADQLLDQMDGRLDDMLIRWQQALRANLQSETVKQSLDAMSAKERKPIEAFLAQKGNDPAIPDGFTRAASQALHGIEAITLGVDALLDALKTGGLPCTVDELQRRFGDYIQKTMRGHDARNTRLTLDQ